MNITLIIVSVKELGSFHIESPRIAHDARDEVGYGLRSVSINRQRIATLTPTSPSNCELPSVSVRFSLPRLCTPLSNVLCAKRITQACARFVSGRRAAGGEI
jgi:hypothetical protein